jgi:ArsR family transcriptional regulator
MHDKNLTIVLKALADPTRLDIVRTLVRDHNDTASCADVSNCSTLSQPALSHHFKKLVDAGVIKEQKRGTQKIYELDSEFLHSVGIDPKKF